MDIRIRRPAILQPLLCLLAFGALHLACAPRSNVNTQCSRNSDCQTGLLCIERVCRAECSEDRDCFQASNPETRSLRCIAAGPGVRACLRGDVVDTDASDDAAGDTPSVDVTADRPDVSADVTDVPVVDVITPDVTATDTRPDTMPTDVPTGTCAAGLRLVPTARGTMVCAHVRADSAILLAHFGPGVRHPALDFAVAQRFDATGVLPVSADWAPTPTTESGHLALQAFDPSGRSVILECGTSVSSVFTVASSALFANFTEGDKGTYGAAGMPGWGFLGSATRGSIRSSHAGCGASIGSTDGQSGEIAYCDGPGAASTYNNHLVSYLSANNPGAPIVGCNRTGCAGASCNLQVWVWLR